jgi:hypothetical protein
MDTQRHEIVSDNSPVLPSGPPPSLGSVAQFNYAQHTQPAENTANPIGIGVVDENEEDV